MGSMGNCFVLYTDRKCWNLQWACHIIDRHDLAQNTKDTELPYLFRLQRNGRQVNLWIRFLCAGELRDRQIVTHAQQGTADRFRPTHTAPDAQPCFVQWIEAAQKRKDQWSRDEISLAAMQINCPRPLLRFRQRGLAEKTLRWQSLAMRVLWGRDLF